MPIFVYAEPRHYSRGRWPIGRRKLKWVRLNDCDYTPQGADHMTYAVAAMLALFLRVMNFQ